jgi:hypothetical protein
VKIVCVREVDLSAYAREDDIAARWYALAPGVSLPLSGGVYQLLCAGRPGGASGPDVRDAVLRIVTPEKTNAPLPSTATSQHQGNSIAGDVEFHVRSSDWFTHQHHTDARYNNVILHVVLVCDAIVPTQRQDGITIPVCSLNDMVHTAAQLTVWPCQHGMSLLSLDERTHLLRRAGVLRFEQKTQAFVAQLLKSEAHAAFSAYDICLISALAEGLGYGRDRDFFRAAGLHLLGLPGKTPEPLGRASDPAPLDAKRLQILKNLVEQWRGTSAWHMLRNTLLPLAESATTRQVLQDLRGVFDGLAASRADILICNVVLPFAAAVALLENDTLLAEQALKLYEEHPGLPSNQVTRAMSTQLQLEREPRNACQQQGLHYIYAQTCREKLCGQCIAGKAGL